MVFETLTFIDKSQAVIQAISVSADSQHP